MVSGAEEKNLFVNQMFFSSVPDTFLLVIVKKVTILNLQINAYESHVRTEN